MESVTDTPSGRVRKATTLKAWIDVIEPGAKALFYIAILFGSLFFAFYSMRLHSFPSDFKGEGFVLVLAFISLGFMHSALLFLCTVPMVSVLWLLFGAKELLSWLPKKIKKGGQVQHQRSEKPDFSTNPLFKISSPLIFSSLFVLVLVSILGYFEYKQRGPSDLIQVLVSYAASGLVLVAAGVEVGRSGQATKDHQKKKVSLYVIAASSALPLVISFGAITNLSMVSMGVRSGNGDVVLVDQKNREIIEKLASIANIPFNPCSIGNDLWIAPNIGLDWHGIGKKDHVRLVDRSTKDQQPSIHFDLESDGIAVLKGDAAKNILLNIKQHGCPLLKDEKEHAAKRAAQEPTSASQ